jgi:DNA-binding transcriptional MerR regulator
MPIKEILKYAKLRDLGPTTLEARQELLEKHRKNLNAKIASLLDHLAALDNKINLYKLKKVS